MRRRALVTYNRNCTFLTVILDDSLGFHTVFCNSMLFLNIIHVGFMDADCRNLSHLMNRALVWDVCNRLLVVTMFDISLMHWFCNLSLSKLAHGFTIISHAMEHASNVSKVGDIGLRNVAASLAVHNAHDAVPVVWIGIYGSPLRRDIAAKVWWLKRWSLFLFDDISNICERWRRILG